ALRLLVEDCLGQTSGATAVVSPLKSVSVLGGQAVVVCTSAFDDVNGGFAVVLPLDVDDLSSVETVPIGVLLRHMSSLVLCYLRRLPSVGKPALNEIGTFGGGGGFCGPRPRPPDVEHESHR